jgi:type II secretory pathway pseudopilin PulG
MNTNKPAFTLVEALISVVLMTIGFAGVYSLVTTSSRIMHETIERQKLNFQANEIIETLQADRKQIEEYSSKDLTRCDRLGGSGKSKHLESMKRWCEKINGDKIIVNGFIGVEKKKDSLGNDIYIATVELSGKDGKNVYVKRVFYAQ